MTKRQDQTSHEGDAAENKTSSTGTQKRPPSPPAAGQPKQRDALQQWLERRQATRRYFITRIDLEQLGLSRGALYAALGRHEKRGHIRKVGARRGMWVIVPPEYQKMGAPPSTWIG